ncbi:replication-associated recombination protein A [Permianibacter sp. IMCC34836]|nr:replication-associated recombination protein A [Permianibacter fluminis]NQD37836.1 replication-associated recombination protein A [Permianibacter fluminis]
MQHAPLAARMRPRNLDEYVGQAHLLGPGKPLRRVLEQGHVHSMIFWGPPGTGKTTLAQMIATTANADFENLSAVLSGVKDIREAVARAEQRLAMGRRTLMFVDEVHRFNKGQQDAFLPYVENGTLIFIGATTENPSFELNSALLSRARVYVLKSLTAEDLLQVLERALTDKARGLGEIAVDFPQVYRERLVEVADGDARKLLNLLDVLVDLADEVDGKRSIREETLRELLGNKLRRFDKGGEQFYDQISALHKSVRGSDPDASLYWYCRMLDGGCDTLYIARRVVRMAVEDIGNADPRGLQLALNAWDVQERLGSPEGELAVAQAIVYLACAAKSNAVYMAYNTARDDVSNDTSRDVPVHLRNAPTKLMKELGYGKQYRYAHDEEGAFAAGENYFPEGKRPQFYYEPTSRGLEGQIREKMLKLRALNEQARKGGKS